MITAGFFPAVQMSVFNLRDIPDNMLLIRPVRGKKNGNTRNSGKVVFRLLAGNCILAYKKSITHYKDKNE